MRKLLSSMTVSLLLLSAPAKVADSPSIPNPGESPDPARTYRSPKLTRAELDALLAKPDRVLVIDVRRPDELSTIGGLPFYFSVQAKDIEFGSAFIPKDRIIVTVSNHAGRAGAAADFLAAHGFNVAGAVGILDYQAEGGTLARFAPPPTPTPAAAEAR